MAPHAEPAVPRRARRLVPDGLPRRGELIAACAVVLVVTHLVFAQLTLVLVIVLAVIGATTRWRRWWLLWPALAGAAWVLTIGPDQALAGFAAGPASVLRHLAAGRAAGDAGHPLSAFSGAGEWLPRQFPVALPLAAAEAAVLGWLAWLRTDEWAVPAPRPGIVAALRAAVTTRVIRDGAVLTRAGCALGTVPDTGAAAELGWAEIVSGVLVTGADEQQVTLASLQLVHAALRRRKPVIVLGDGRDGAVAAALAAACQSTGTPLRHGGGDQAPAGQRPDGPDGASASQLWGRANRGGENSGGGNGDGSLAGGGLTRVIGDRSAVLLPVGSPELADVALASLTALAAALRGIGVDGDALVWAPHAERLPPRALGALLRDGASAGLAVLAGTTSPAAAAALAGQAGATITGRLTDPELAAVLAARTGTRLLPPTAAAALAGRQPGDYRSPEPGDRRPSGPDDYRPPKPGGYYLPEPGEYRPSEPPPSSPVAAAAGVASAPELVPCPVVPARVLLALRRDEFVLAVSVPRPRHVAPGRLVPARLPRPPAVPPGVAPGVPPGVPPMVPPGVPPMVPPGVPPMVPGAVPGAVPAPSAARASRPGSAGPEAAG